MKKLIPVFILALIMSACEKEVDINLDAEAEKLVVEGQIEAGLPPLVKLSTSIGFFDKVDLSTVLNSFVHDAEVFVSDETRTVKLKEYAVEIGGYSGYVYSIDTADITSLSFVGEPNKSYKLKIIYKGETYESETTIPEFNMGVDSFWSELPENDSLLSVDPTYRSVLFQYNDDPKPGQFVRIFSQVNDGLMLPQYYSVNNDDIINGTSININLEKGIDKFADTLNFDTYNLFNVGDSITLKWSAIDKATYDFFSTLEFSYGTVGNPFSSPVVVSTNITNGALGVWAGYASTYYTYVVED